MPTVYWPFDPSRISYGYGNAPGYGGWHNGIDFSAAQGTPLRATVSGTIRNNDAGAVDGAGVDISTPDGYMARMWHVSKFLVPNGSQVNAGDVVALSGGARGSWGAGNSTGAHLHWGIAQGRKGNNWNWVNPASLNPVPFDQPKPTPTRKKKQVGAFYRTPDGGIMFQREPNTAFTAIALPTWLAYEANGARYYDISQADMDVLVGKYGTY